MNSCPICLDDLQDKTKASPDSCDHIFCLQCIQKWSKMGSYCPVDRKRFKKIQNLDSDSLIQVKPNKRKRRKAVYDFSSSCEVCSNSTNANLLLLCDSCDLGYHTHCLKPPLKEVPAGLWYCPTCISVEKKLKKKNGITKEVEAELGGFDSINMKEKVIDKINSKGKKLDSPETAKGSYSLQACYDTISVFEGITVKKDKSKVTNTNYLHYINEELDRMDKRFVNKEEKRQSIENYRHLETYSVTYANRRSERMKPFDVNRKKKSAFEDLCINPSYSSVDTDSASSDVYLEKDPSEHYNNLPNKSFENSRNRKKLASETLSINARGTSLDKDGASSDRAVIASYSEDSVPSSSRLRNKSSKGTSKNFIKFSVFQRIEGIDASQEICPQISSAKVPLSSNCLQQCSLCCDFTNSEMQCKSCQLKYFNAKESQRFSNYVKILKKGLSNKQHENIKWNEAKYEPRPLKTQEKMSNNALVLERRKRSLIRTLKKIRDSKRINIINVN